MKKYLIVAKNTWDETLVYRLNFVMWRLRNVVFILSIYFLWYAVLPEGRQLFGYDQESILTYVLGTSFIAAIVLSNRSFEIGEEINQGDLSNHLLRPANYFAYWFSRDLGDKVMNILFSLAELILIFLILKPPIFIQSDPVTFALFAVFLLLAIILHFFMNVLLGLVGFWSPDVWAPRFIFYIIVGFFAGTYFPLDILPPLVYEGFTLLPFSYLVYFPMKLYLGQLALTEIIKGITILILWTGAVSLVVEFFWRRGLRNYSAQGR